LIIPLAFPDGLSPGAGKSPTNRLVISRDGLHRPVLRGSAVAGVLRHAFEGSKCLPLGSAIEDWFGSPADREHGVDQGAPSPLRVADIVFPDTDTAVRTHISVDRHSGAVREKGGLFELEALPPGTHGTLITELHSDHKSAHAFIQALVAVLDIGILAGGNAARGLGMMKRSGQALVRTFDLTKAEDHAAFLDERRLIRQGRMPSAEQSRRIEVSEPELQELRDKAKLLVVTLSLAVPRGQDILVGDGQALDCEVEPQRCPTQDGKVRWRIPGSTLRGVLRGWVTRLARKEGAGSEGGTPYGDSVERYLEHGPGEGGEIGWGFDSKEDRERKLQNLTEDHCDDQERLARLERLVPCPVMRLFGSMYSRGRVHVSDAYSEPVFPDSKPNPQRRAHVAIDYITGGAIEGFLFENDVLCSEPRLSFTTTLTLENPSADEARWLAESIRALDWGLIRIGSSKAGGRLALAARLQADGPHHEFFTNLTPCELNDGY
jgi:CRISPR/Cas system CSM-associated protein Csm3 (group 7 of RAMP superfamily)